MKATVVGAGNVGATTAEYILQEGLADVYLVDVVDGLAAGKALDMAEAAPILGHSCSITGGTDYGPAEGSDIVVVTAGVARKPGMSRDDLLKINGNIMADVATNIWQAAPDAIVIVVSNPLDVTTHIFHETSGFPTQRVMGMAGVLDTARFRTFIAMEAGCSPEDVSAMVLGGHGDSMVPLASQASVSGVPVTQLLDDDTIARLVQRTRDGGAEIVGLLKTGSAYYAPAAAVTQMVSSILRNENRILPACAYVTGQYGIRNIFIGVPVKLGARGVEEIIEIDLTADELTALRGSGAHVEEAIQGWNAMKGSE
ncbi:MAG TPA: malate dehydrogenase [Armatimonadota bacterium]|nr:malate dehydrogenase [Armatimonadota bacterium]